MNERRTAASGNDGRQSIIPIFPLTGALLLPHGRLPLHIFEPRYRNMIEDVLAGSDAVIGIIQPLDDNSAERQADLFEVGCSGRIEKWQRLPDGRYVILLEGLARFRVSEELELQRGYRRVSASYSGFESDREGEIGNERLLSALENFCRTNGVRYEPDKLADLSGLSLLNSMAMSLPFAPAEKQALLEAPEIGDRERLLLKLMEMGVVRSGTEFPPLLN